MKTPKLPVGPVKPPYGSMLKGGMPATTKKAANGKGKGR